MRDRIPEATVARLPVYLRCLVDMSERGTHRVSSDQLADAAGVNSAKVRKDLSYLGSYGTRGVGYDVEYLIYQVRRELGLEQDWAVAIVGVGNLGHALANYRGFAERGFRIAALWTPTAQRWRGGASGPSTTRRPGPRGKEAGGDRIIPTPGPRRPGVCEAGRGRSHLES